jgi:hypothetical protein
MGNAVSTAALYGAVFGVATLVVAFGAAAISPAISYELAAKAFIGFNMGVIAVAFIAGTYAMARRGKEVQENA